MLIKDIEAGGRHCLAVSTDGKLYGWGFGFYHQLGLKEDNEDHLDPVMITIVENVVRIGEDGREEKLPGKQKPVKSIACGYFHSGVILKSKH